MASSHALTWSESIDVFTNTMAAVRQVIEHIDDPDAAGLGEWDLKSLAGHTLRAVTTLSDYLAAPEAAPPVLEGASDYLNAYLAARAGAPEEMDAAVAERSRQGAAGMSIEEITEAMSTTAAHVAGALHSAGPDRRVGTRFGALCVAEYLRTRQLELVVDGHERGRAIGVEFAPPPAAELDALYLLSESAQGRGIAPRLLAALTGRSTGEDVLPVLR
jgi:hypothetical protein